MIKAKTNQGDLILGLSNENIRRLKNGEPIKFSMSEIFPDIEADCIIFNGKDEKQMMKSMPLGPTTKFHL